jgi:beta-lactamase regulating signal transducer with metallopeptidase domain
MSNLTSIFGGVFQWVLQTTCQAAVLTGLILLAQRLLRKRLAPAWRYGLWLLLVIRLLMPVLPQSSFSIFNLAKSTPSHPVAASLPPVASTSIRQALGKKFHTDDPIVTKQSGAPTLGQSVSATKSTWKMDWFGVALCGWLGGVCFFGARLVWTNWRFRARIGRYNPIADENVMQLFNECRAVFNITKRVQLIESEEVESPAVYGFWEKWLLLPDGIFERFSREELRCIFLHELAHIKRGDLLVSWFVAGVQVLHWFNLVLWLAWARMRADREMATDALVLAHVRKSSHAPYGETILKVLEALTGERTLPELVGIVESKAQLKERLAAISRPGNYWKWAALVVTALIGGIGLTGAQTANSGLSNTPGTSQPALTSISGTWQAQDVAFAPWTFTLNADGDKVTGTVQQGETNGEWRTSLTGATAIYDGVITGNHISFKCDSPDGGRTISFSGLLAVDSIAFTREVKVQPGAYPGMDGIYGASGATNFTAKRFLVSAAETAPPTVAPTDKGEVSNPAGNSQPDLTGITGTWQAKDVAFAPWTFTFKGEGDKVTGTVSMGTSSVTTSTTSTVEAPIYDGVVLSNNVSFKCDSPMSGSGNTITFSGMMTGDIINFTREVKVKPGANPGFNGIYGASGATNFTAKRFPL